METWRSLPTSRESSQIVDLVRLLDRRFARSRIRQSNIVLSFCSAALFILSVTRHIQSSSPSLYLLSFLPCFAFGVRSSSQGAASQSDRAKRKPPTVCKTVNGKCEGEVCMNSIPQTREKNQESLSRFLAPKSGDSRLSRLFYGEMKAARIRCIDMAADFGISYSTMRKWLQNPERASMDAVVKIAKYLGISKSKVCQEWDWRFS